MRLGVSGALLGALLCAGCPSNDETLVYIGGQTVDAKTIDADPLAMLPGGALILGQLDAAALFATSLGPAVGQIATNLLPLGVESNFVPSRDVKRIYAATYSMQGADFCAILQGNFDETAIRRAAQRMAQTPSGVPVVETHYAGNSLYTVSNIGFAVLTPSTILSGNETAMRRALDRLRLGKLDRSLPPWMQELFATQGADFVLAADLSAENVIEAAAPQVPFLPGLRIVRVLGNFRPPGTNIVGALTYADNPSATQGVQALNQLQQFGSFTTLLALLGFAPKIPPVTVAQQGRDVAFSVAVDSSTAVALLDFFTRLTQPHWTRR